MVIYVSNMKISDPEALLDLLDPLKIRLLRQLSQGGVLTERRLAAYTNVSHVTARQILQRFARHNLASSKRVGRANLWSINRKNYAYLMLEPVLAQIDAIEPPKEVLKKMLLECLPQDRLESLILFGSVVSGEERDDSDIDVCVILRPKTKADDEKLGKGLDLAVERCYELFGKRLSPHIFTAGSWKAKRGSPLVKQIREGERIFP